MSYDRNQVAHYESDPEHMLPPEEADVWLRLMSTWSDGARHCGPLLDIGAGTGLLTVVMKNAGVDTVSLEPSRTMIEEALRRNPELSEADLVEGHAGDAGLFAPRASTGSCRVRFSAT